MKPVELYIVAGLVTLIVLYITAAQQLRCEGFTDDPDLKLNIAQHEQILLAADTWPHDDKRWENVAKIGFPTTKADIQKELDELIKKRDAARAAAAAATTKVVASTTPSGAPSVLGGTADFMTGKTPATGIKPEDIENVKNNAVSSANSVLGIATSTLGLVAIVLAALAVGIMGVVAVLNVTGVSSVFRGQLPYSPVPPPPSW